MEDTSSLFLVISLHLHVQGHSCSNASAAVTFNIWRLPLLISISLCTRDLSIDWKQRSHPEACSSCSCQVFPKVPRSAELYMVFSRQAHSLDLMGSSNYFNIFNILSIQFSVENWTRGDQTYTSNSSCPNLSSLFLDQDSGTSCLHSKKIILGFCALTL